MPLGFDTTAIEVVEGVRLDGRTMLVTGASTGLGLETARVLAGAGARVVLTVRTEEKAISAQAAIREYAPDALLEVGILDLASFESVRDFSREFLAGHECLDVLINNAGVSLTPLKRTIEGFELQFATNHLGPFLLTALLTPALRAAAPSRVVNVSSYAHRFSDIHWDDPNYHSRPYNTLEAYGQSKTAVILFTRELDRRLRADGVRSYAVHPGRIATEIFRYVTDEELLIARKKFVDADASPAEAFKSIESGAATTVWAAVAPELTDKGGAYLSDCEVSDKDASYTRDPRAAERLWALSEELVGETFV